MASLATTRPYPNKTRIMTYHPCVLQKHKPAYKTISQQNKDEEMSSGHFDSEAQRERRTEHFRLLIYLSQQNKDEEKVGFLNEL